ncbi:hypothetical protein B7494_g1814 [Chlorociboria aeruginascens]|nr:hypothetical protein B7494_g1814 [Chlorociboria aeruginascens]
MIRLGSAAKWKEVLGFDEGKNPAATSKAPNNPSPYSDAPEALASHPSPSLRLTDHYPQLPRDITFTQISRHGIHLSASCPPPAPDDIKPLPQAPPLLYVNISDSDSANNPKSNKPDVALYSSASSSAPLLSFANFDPVTLNTEIVLCPPSQNPQQSPYPYTPPLSTTASPISPSQKSADSLSSFTPITPQHTPTPVLQTKTSLLTPTGGIFTTEKHIFSHTLARTSVQEKFEWRHSTAPVITGISRSNSNSTASRSFTPTLTNRPTSPTSGGGGSINGKGKIGSKLHNKLETVMQTGAGLKLVRLSTGETVAVYAGTNNEGERGKKRVVGMLRFVSGEGGQEMGLGLGMSGLGEEWEVLALMSLLCVVERGKRAARALGQIS